MFTLKERQDGYRLLFPKELIPEEINEKYTRILTDAHSFIVRPIDFVNETVQSIDVFGFSGATMSQQQPYTGEPLLDPYRIRENEFQYPSSDVIYRSTSNPVAIVDKTLNVNFRHTLGYVNYMILLESFMYQYSRDMNSEDIPYNFSIDLKDDKGSIYAKIVIDGPMIDSMDMLSFDYTKPIAESQTFKVVWKYSNFDYVMINASAVTNEIYGYSTGSQFI